MESVNDEPRNIAIVEHPVHRSFARLIINKLGATGT